VLPIAYTVAPLPPRQRYNYRANRNTETENTLYGVQTVSCILAKDKQLTLQGLVSSGNLTPPRDLSDSWGNPIEFRLKRMTPLTSKTVSHFRARWDRPAFLRQKEVPQMTSTHGVTIIDRFIVGKSALPVLNYVQ